MIRGRCNRTIPSWSAVCTSRPARARSTPPCLGDSEGDFRRRHPAPVVRYDFAEPSLAPWGESRRTGVIDGSLDAELPVQQLDHTGPVIAWLISVAAPSSRG